MRSKSALRCSWPLIKLSVGELAALAHVSTDTIVMLEKGDALMPRTLADIQAALEAAGVKFGADDAVAPRPR